jgi:hypothetical protein
VTLTNKATGSKQATQADAQGAFAFPVVPGGMYELMVSAKASACTGARTSFLISAALQLETPLKLAWRSENVTVTEDAAQVERSDTKLGQVIGSNRRPVCP